MKTLILADEKPKESLIKLAQNCEIIIVLGDLFYSDLKELENINLPKIGIHGNHDFDKAYNPNQEDFFPGLGIIDLHLKTYKFKEFVFLLALKEIWNMCLLKIVYLTRAKRLILMNIIKN